jgi:hypothetical protein
VFAQIVVLDITKIQQDHYIVSFAQLGIIVHNRDKQIQLSAVSISILKAEQLQLARIVIQMNMPLKAQDGVTSAHQDASVYQRASPFVIHHLLLHQTCRLLHHLKL